MIEFMLALSNKKSLPPLPSLPGPADLITGDANLGFYGEVSGADFITYPDLSVATKMDQYGTQIYPDGIWLKVAYKGKVLYIPKQSIRQNVTWTQLFSLGLVYANQNKTIDIKGHRFIVRLMQGSNVDPYTGDNDSLGGPATTGTEWNLIMYGLMPGAVPGALEGPALANYTTSELSLSPLSGGTSVYVAERGPGGNALVRTNGSGNIRFLALWNNIDTSDQYRGWRPVLEYVGPADTPIVGPFMLYDPVLNKDLIGNNVTPTINTQTTRTIDNRLNGYGTLTYAGINAGARLTFKTPVPFDDRDWTIEYDAMYTTFGTNTQYCNDIYGYMSNASSYIWSVFGDSGWSYQMQAFAGAYAGVAPTDNANTYRYGPPRTDFIGVPRRVAMVCKNGIISIYRDGKLTQVQANTNTNPTQPANGFPKRPTGAMNYLLLGYINSTWPCSNGNFGRIAFYDYAKYQGNEYEVKPITT